MNPEHNLIIYFSNIIKKGENLLWSWHCMQINKCVLNRSCFPMSVELWQLHLDNDKSFLYSSRRRQECSVCVGIVRLAGHDYIIDGHYGSLFAERSNSIEVTRYGGVVKPVHKEGKIYHLFLLKLILYAYKLISLYVICVIHLMQQCVFMNTGCCIIYFTDASCQQKRGAKITNKDLS